MIRTRVGYTGGSKSDPTYYDLGDHSETVQLDFDPGVITYEELLRVFFAAHDATQRGIRAQYKSAVFFHSAEQERLALEIKAREEARLGKTVQTEIVAASTFYLAEDYHQKYALQGARALKQELERFYPDIADLVDSTAATRVNAYLYGLGDLEQLRRELDSLGLSEESRKRLLDMFD